MSVTPATIELIEYAAAALGLANIALLVFRSVWNFPFGMAMVALYILVFYEERLYAEAGLQVSGLSAVEDLCEMIELPETEHPWFVGCQFHPEFTSTPRAGHPLFKAFIEAALIFAGKRAASAVTDLGKLKSIA